MRTAVAQQRVLCAVEVGTQSQCGCSAIDMRQAARAGCAIAGALGSVAGGWSTAQHASACCIAVPYCIQHAYVSGGKCMLRQHLGVDECRAVPVCQAPVDRRGRHRAGGAEAREAGPRGSPPLSLFVFLSLFCGRGSVSFFTCHCMPPELCCCRCCLRHDHCSRHRSVCASIREGS